MKTTSKYLGAAEFSGKVIISDPCYDRGTRCAQADFPVMPGRYLVFAVHSDEGDMGRRVAALVFCHKGFVLRMYKDEWKEVLSNIGVDSGQCGIFDDTIYPQSKDSPENNPFYDECCDITLHGDEAGILQSRKGAVSSSGYGDGCYGLRAVEFEGEFVALLLDYDLEKMRLVMSSLLARQTLAAMAKDENKVVITRNSEHICIEGHVGTWHIIGERDSERHGKLFLLEHDAYGDDAACLIVNEIGKILVLNVYNGFLDYEEWVASHEDEET